MGVTLMEFGIYVRRGLIFTIRSIANHPSLMFLVPALIYISKSYPYVFSLLVSASPVLLCTAALLGTLLLYGQQNTPETETEKKTRYESLSIKNGMSNDEQNDSKRDNKVEKVGAEPSLVVNKLAPIRVGFSVDGVGKERRRSVGVESENSEACEARRELEEAMQQQKGEDMVDHYAIISKVIGDLLESGSEHENSGGSKSEDDADSSDVDSHAHEEENDDSDSDSNSNSDSDKSHSSPNASTDGTAPILDELHPLLAAQSAQISRAGSEAALTEKSPPSSTSISSSSSIDSGEETEVQDSEEGERSKKKSVITWTEEDQKNLMDLGSSEIERNQRLERILRRRRNMSMSMVPEISLIDLENPDLQFNIPPISTRRNPFDIPQDSAPGSAPSVMSQRRNPFDLPFDEEDDEDEPEQELRPSQLRQPFLRRRDHFLARPSIFAQERQRMKPFFVPAAEESNSSSLRGQSSGKSSGHETESVSSVEDSEEEKIVEGEAPHEQHVEEEEHLKSGSDSMAVYDTSPSAVGKNYSSSSSFSDLHAHAEVEADKLNS